MNYDIFNGDADGICALIQLRNAEPRDAALVTGVKRDTQLLTAVDVAAGDQLTVLDLPMDKNRHGLERALAAGARVFYVDHHHTDNVPEDVNLTAIINNEPDTCTSVLVNEFLGGEHIKWAITGAFGDDLRETAHRLGRFAGLSTADLLSLEELGIYLNYNSFGPSLDDLNFDPRSLYQVLCEVGDPLSFIHHSQEYLALSEAYRADIAKTSDLHPIHANDKGVVFVLPDEPWVRRISSFFVNYLVTSKQGQAHAVLIRMQSGSYRVTVRAPLGDLRDADTVCGQFPTGGGSPAVATISDLPESSVDNFVAAFSRAYGN